MTEGEAPGPIKKFFADRNTRRLEKDAAAVQQEQTRKMYDKALQDVIDGKQTGTDQGDALTGQIGFPWSSAQYGQSPIGTLFEEIVTDSQLAEAYSRYQLARVIIDAPIEDGLANGFRLIWKGRGNGHEPTDEETKNFNDTGQKYFLEDKTHLLRFFKLTRLEGRSFLIFGYEDSMSDWARNRPEVGTKFKWTQPTPKQYVANVQVSTTIPLKVQYIRVNFGTEVFSIGRSRFLFAYNPKLTTEDKEGESALSSIWNLLTVQVHVDWALGQAMWRNASKLYGLKAPRKNLTVGEKLEALAGVSNINARTVLYLPWMWDLKDLSRGGGNVAISRTYKTMLEQISAGSRIPMSVLMGSQRTGLSAAEEDWKHYYRLVNGLQENLMKPQLKAYYRHRQRAGDLPPGEFDIVFNEIDFQSPKQKAAEDLEMLVMKRLKEGLENTEWMKMFSAQELTNILKRK